VGQAFVQVEAYITNKGINLTVVPVMITVLETEFGEPDCVTTAERKLEVCKQTNHDFSTKYKEFQSYTADIEWNNPAKCTAFIRCLNSENNDALALSDNVPQQFQKLVAFLQWLDN
jgi:hypothetical protein